MPRKIHIRGKLCVPVLCLVICLLLVPFRSLGDDAGVLTEEELNAWLQQLLLSTREQRPLNEPVNEESLTEYGYAFLYDMATLYYDRPALSPNSRLLAVALIEEGFPGPRGLGLGAPQDILMEAYGWQNPMLIGDGSIAALYSLNKLPRAAYWAWAQYEGTLLQSVRCAIHVQTADSRYTDAGISYQLDGGAVSGMIIYGLQETIAPQEMQSNLAAVAQARGETPGADSESPLREAGSLASHASIPQNDAPAFGPGDLQFSSVDFCTLGEKGADAAFGPSVKENLVRDDTGEWLRTVEREGITLVYGLDRDQKNSRLQMFSFTKAGLEGPRGVHIGQTLEEAAALFHIDGATGAMAAETGADGIVLLYGDGQTPPYGALEEQGGDLTLRYAAHCKGADGEYREATLRLAFEGNLLTEIMLYAW
ncbi:MAG: hypothetical protein FWF86_05365 [Clostridia bacterium]|nr:hypothetical protein [Clostridia bacterium]